MSIENVIKNNLEEQKFWNNNDIWKEDGEEWSKYFNGTDNLWSKFIFPKIRKYMQGYCLEIAPGHGRITSKLLPYFSKIHIIDMNENCIKRCKEKFLNEDKIFYYTNNGISLSCIKDNSIDFIFSWDSFVHMHEKIIETYIAEINKKMKINSFGAIHHSFLSGGDDLSFSNIGGRSNFNPEKFKDICEKNGISIVKQYIFDFNKVKDVFSVFKK